MEQPGQAGPVVRPRCARQANRIFPEPLTPTLVRTTVPRRDKLLLSLLIPVTLLSLPLLVACLILWPRSHYHADSVWFNAHNHARAVISNAGHLKVFIQRVSPSAPFTITADAGHRAQPPSDPRPDMRDPGLDTHGYFAGFAYAAGPTSFGHNRVLLLPFWFLTLASAAPPFLLAHTLRRSRRLHRQRHNLCPRCAYDLRASTTQCPECGTPIPSSA